jgi:hypothetical protein
VAGDDARHCSYHCRFVEEIKRFDIRAATSAADSFSHIIQASRIARREHHMRARCSQRLRHGKSQPA